MKKLTLLALILLLFTAALLLTACAAPEAATTAPEASTAQAEDFDYHYNLGVKYLSEGNYQEAVLAFTAAIDIDPKRADAYVGRGDAYLGLDDAANARPDYERAIELDGALIDAFLGVIEACIRQNDFDAALEWAKQALDKTGDSRFEEKIAEPEAQSERNEVQSGNIRDTAIISGKVMRTDDAFPRETAYYKEQYERIDEGIVLATGTVFLFDQPFLLIDNEQTVELVGAILATNSIKELIGKHATLSGKFHKQDEKFQSVITGPHPIDGGGAAYYHNPVGPYLFAVEGIITESN